MGAIGTAAAGSGIGAAAGAVGGLIQGALNFRYQKKLMEKQNQYDIAAFERENARQDYLMENSQQIAKNALRQAGYSTADPNGTGVTAAPTNNMDVPQQASFNVPIGEMAMQGAMMAAQLQNVRAQTEKTKAETDMQYLLNDLKALYGEDEVITNLNNIDSNTARNLAEAMKAQQDRINSIVITDATKANIEERLAMDWMKVFPELSIMAQQIENLKAQKKVTEAQEREVYQNIKESQQRIANLINENKLTSADIAVAKATKAKIEQETKTEKNRTSSAASNARVDKIEADAKSLLGSKYAASMEVVDDITRTGERIGNVVSSFIPFTDKVETSSEQSRTRYNGNGEAIGTETVFNHNSSISSKARGKR